MNRTAIVSALALALAASTMAAAGGAGQNDTTEVAFDHGQEARIATLDPAELRAAIEAGEAFEVPTFDGHTSAIAGARVQPLISYTDAGPDGEPLTVERAPNVWHLEDEDGARAGGVLSFDHTFRAWLLDGDGVSFVEPLTEGPGVPLPIRDYRVYHVPGLFGGGPGPGDEDGGVGILSHISVWKDVYAYVDTQYRDQYGSCCWAAQVNYILNLLNAYFDDVELEYDYHGGQVDSGFNTNNMDTAWSRLLSRSYNGADVKSYWSYRDFDGCEIGTADFPGDMFITQHKSDVCHLGQLPGSDAERAYFTAHELGKNNHAHPNYHWSDTTLFGHEHRSIMDDSLWGHLHGCWSQTNMNRMSSYLGTSSVGAPC